MKTTFLFARAALLALLLSTQDHQLSTACAQGALTPPNPPAPTMKTLDQIEARTPISSVPYTISVPGSYYLTTNVTATVSNAIVIAISGVTLDLNGFTISSTTASATGHGILLNSGLCNITILNGFIQSGVTNNGSGVFNGPGFRSGIYCPGTPPLSTRISGISVLGCRVDGILLSTSVGGSTTVDSCTVQTVGGVGIAASTITRSVAADCGAYGIFGDQVSDCRGESVGVSGGSGIYANTVQNCRGISNSGEGIRAYTAQNCYGTSSSGTGIYAVTSAANCYGSGGGTGQGIYTETANNCHGQSVTSQGISAETANNCYGYSSLNRGISANIVIGCTGRSNGGSFGVFATSIANTSYGSSATGTGLSANIAIGCTGTTISYNYKYNMP
ncbi:MAG TPA: hypothetical protein VK530_07080 [Candidatus Acidoferrum sp.]|nr:hypothetical protein [Candidatus Acidoferrum sp.]